VLSVEMCKFMFTHSSCWKALYITCLEGFFMTHGHNIELLTVGLARCVSEYHWLSPFECCVCLTCELDI